MVTVLTGNDAYDVEKSTGIGGQLWISDVEAKNITGWEKRPEGFCQGNVCVPVPAGREEDFVRGDQVNISELWRYMGHPALSDSGGHVWSLGVSAANRFENMASLKAPDFELPDLRGKTHRLSDHLGKKVFLVSWASW